MPRHDLRRNARLVFSATVKLQWLEPDGEPRFAQGRSKDLSEDGLRLELPVPIPVRTIVTLAIQEIGFQGTASIRHVRQAGLKYVTGLALSRNLRHVLTANVQENKDLNLLLS